MPESMSRKKHRIHSEPGGAIQGDQTLVECRKPGKWQTVRGTDQHHSFTTVASKNAYAVLVMRFTKVKG